MSFGAGGPARAKFTENSPNAENSDYNQPYRISLQRM